MRGPFFGAAFDSTFVSEKKYLVVALPASITACNLLVEIED